MSTRLENNVFVSHGARVRNLISDRGRHAPRVVSLVPWRPRQKRLALRRGSPSERSGQRGRLFRLGLVIVGRAARAARAKRLELRELSINERARDSPGFRALHLGGQRIGLR